MHLRREDGRNRRILRADGEQSVFGQDSTKIPRVHSAEGGEVGGFTHPWSMTDRRLLPREW